MSDNNALLVTGASGALGRQAVEYLLEIGASPIIATTRTPEKLSDLAARGVDVRKADFEDPTTLTAAFAGAKRVLLVSTDALSEPGARTRQHIAAIEAAKEAGVEHILYTSFVAARPTRTPSIAGEHFDSELAVMKSGLSWTILRNGLYAEMLLGSLPQAVQSGQLYSAGKDGRTAYTARADCARAAAAALASDDTENMVYLITGPEALTQADIAQIAGEVTGHPVSYVPVGPEAIKTGFTGAGFPDNVADLFVGMDVDISENLFAATTPTVEELTGTKPITVRDLLNSNKAVFDSAA